MFWAKSAPCLMPWKQSFRLRLNGAPTVAEFVKCGANITECHTSLGIGFVRRDRTLSVPDFLAACHKSCDACQQAIVYD